MSKHFTAEVGNFLFAAKRKPSAGAEGSAGGVASRSKSPALHQGNPDA